MRQGSGQIWITPFRGGEAPQRPEDILSQMYDHIFWHRTTIFEAASHHADATASAGVGCTPPDPRIRDHCVSGCLVVVNNERLPLTAYRRAIKVESRIALSRAHTPAKAADVAKLLLLNRRRTTHIQATGSMAVPSPNCNPNPTVSA